MRSATPGTILILAATILLVLVTCSSPIIKSIAFLTATIGGSGSQKGDTISLGCLGYCLDNKCVGPTIGYSFDPTQLLGVATSVEGFNVDTSQYSTTVIKALTYALVLHPIALGACVLTLLFGILAHCGDLSLRCLNSVFASIASLVTLIAVGCDFALFIIAQKRINAISGASASLGSALWMTLIAWILIILSSFTFCCSCCGTGGSGRKGRVKDEYDDDAWKGGGRKGNNYADQMRMDALDAEAERKRRNKADLPKFAVYETEHVESLPLKQDYEDSSSGAAGFAANGAGIRGGHSGGGGGGGAGGQGYGNQYNYADPGYTEHGYGGAGQGGYGGQGYGGHGYTPSSEHADYAYGYADGGPGHVGVAESYIPGVGPGAHRGESAAAVYYDGSQGPMSPSHQSASTYPNYNDNASTYSYGTQRAPSMTSNRSRGQTGGDPYNLEDAPPVPEMPLHLQQRQPTQEYGGYSNTGHEQYPSTSQYGGGGGHAVDYSGATFGGATSSTPYDAVHQATSAASRSRALPSTQPTSDSRQSGIIYSPTSPNPTIPGSRSRGAIGASGDDGFGFAVLQAGAAAAAANNNNNNNANTGQNNKQWQNDSQRVTSPVTYDDRSREAWASPTRSRPLPSAPSSSQQQQSQQQQSQQQQSQYNNQRAEETEERGYSNNSRYAYSEEEGDTSQSLPPGYESDGEAVRTTSGGQRQQQQQHYHPYPNEKR